MSTAPALGRVYLVGAGPGDPALITLRALRHLQQADVVLYDALVHPELLEHAPPGAERVFVGKRGGRVSERQTAINDKLVAAARAGHYVVRLKGGDPYLFGRGSEEAEALAEAGIPFEVVPGVPSPLAATAYAGLSLTHRDLASSVAYITATESPEKDASSHDWARLATATQTLVIFMGRRRLAGLMQSLMAHGRAPTTPVAVVQWASLPRQRTVVGTVADIHQRVAEAGIGTPALTIVGEVVTLRDSLRWFDNKPLFGRRVLVTRAVDQAGALVSRLRAAGADTLCVPTIRIAPPDDDDALRATVRGPLTYDLIAFTSANAVRAFFDALYAARRDARALGAARVLAIGPKTADELRERGVNPEFVPDDSTAEGVLAALDGVLHAGARVLLPRAEVAREVLPDTLRSAGVLVDVVTAYQTLGPDAATCGALRAALSDAEDEDGVPPVDTIAFTSSSTVRNLMDALTAEGLDARTTLASRTLLSIGPITSATLRSVGLEPTLEASPHTVAAMVETLEAHARARTDTP
ncbi:MAG: uroporphyrinogen-III C-methyltransferase [Sandaracinaceae bacterium]|nr:uroporphyrinogen-III C-methyltransferase [Sandaracinaceae bacterium]